MGDLIDRGPDQLEVLEIVRSMVDAGQALVVMGNHEFNAIAFTVRNPLTEDTLRPRTDKNRRQHARFLAAVGEDSPKHREWVDWFRTLPMSLDLGGLRVVHGWWGDAEHAAIREARGGDGALTDERMAAMFNRPELKAARKRLTCGVEWDLPKGASFVDAEGHSHGEARMAVWRHWAERLPEVAIVPPGHEDRVPDLLIPDELRIGPVTGSPILFGHHWFSGTPCLETPKVACLDWSAARGGPLVAYRWSGEDELRHEHLVAAGEEP